MSNPKTRSNNVTLWLSKAFEFFLLNNPKATGYGIIIGAVLEGSKEALAKLVGIPVDVILSIKWYVFICVPIVFTNIPFMFRRYRIDPAFETKLYQLDEMLKRADLSEEKKRLLYIESVTKMINDIPPDSEQPIKE